MCGWPDGGGVGGGSRGLRSFPAGWVVLWAAVVAKLAYEQLVGPLPGSEAAAGGAVVVNAHLYGAIGGALSACVFWRRVPTPASI